MKYVLGIDIGTSGCKSVLLNEKGSVVKTESIEYFAQIGADGSAEQNPNEWYEASIECIKKFSRIINLDDIVAVSATGQMQGITMIGFDGEPTRDSILWNDIRCEKEVEELNSKHLSVLKKGCCSPANTSFTISKIMWMKNNEPENWEKTEKFTFASNFITYKLTGRITADENNICMSGMNDLRKNIWSEEIIKATGVEMDKVPELTGCFDKIGTITKKAAAETGLKEGTVVIAGGGDASTESYSVGIAGTGKLKVRLGTAADLNAVFSEKLYINDEDWGGTRDVLPGHILLGSYTKSCALSIKWVRDVFYGENISYNEMDMEAEKIPLGCGGLLYHPYLQGEFAPYFNSSLRAKFNGINAGHRRPHFLRAAYEGVSFSIRDVMCMADVFKNSKQLIFVGGGTKSKLWMSILVDVLGKGGIIPKYCDAAYGVALMAGHAMEIFDSKRVITEAMREAVEIDFNKENHEKYNEIFKRYMGLAGK